ncbi:ABC-type dipeptide/oligopeptide/nickel transport system, permease component [Halogeometricum borinquense DSM 11551]|uniref:ABC-type dipeptide/oligopeptide/nickel transport system, permease component n=1 Tax=Halogeometricum borinquense (strain ATCC 700274 / DSM 11551 / JCM 10706 / KCTC 4070 / PR3) TaxID=469382 RepID=E4NWP2_HALBP|nr:ABC transporter permease [Halogeometricum borinquense]ADQ69462.1 ABC-type dipeptide/oligopeptide/nickel transport system, permease component [Halogeometricum borinquense DSM 11551]ELY25770.1 ABC-type dipeptide/oligopeptide/nickel transport system, permease component [Halogeometricum borinquense DSM 11551]
MKHTDTDTVDGSEFTFETSSSVETSRRERLSEFYEEFIYKPGLVAWSDWRTRIGSLLLVVYILMGTVGAWVWRYPSTNQAPRFVPPLQNLNYPLGTTATGQDLAALIIHATPDMLIMVTAGGIWATGIALVIGTVAGYKGGSIDRLLTSASDVAMSIPGLPLIMVLAVVFSPENPILIGILITINYWAGLGRAIRSQVLTIRGNSYVEASRTMGVSTTRILTKDIIPNLMPYVLVSFVNAARYVIFASVGLYFLGILPFSTLNWGVTLNLAYTTGGALYLPSLAYWLIAPMVAIMGLSLAMILLAQGLDRVFNPRVRTRLAGESTSTAEGDEEDTVTGVLT